MALWKSILWKVFQGCMILLFSIVIVYCFKYSKEGKTMGDLLKAGMIYLVILAPVYAGLCLAEKYLEKWQKFLMPAFLVTYGIILLALCCGSRGTPHTDSKIVFQAAQHMAGLSDEITWTYLARADNLVMPSVFKGFLYRIVAAFGVKDVYYVTLVTNLLQVLAALYCVFGIMLRLTREHAASWLVVLMVATHMPVFGHTQSVYTDAASFCFGAVIVYMWIRIREKQYTGVKKALMFVLMGLIASVGMEVKMTCIIPFIAILGYELVYDKWKELLWHLIPAAMMVCTLVGCKAYIHSVPEIMEHYHTWGFPTTAYFVALGMERDGSYSMDSEFIHAMADIYGMEEKKAFTYQYIKDHINVIWDRQHMVSKLVYNYADGKLGADDFYQIIDASEKGFVYNYIAYGGEHNGDYRANVTGRWYAVVLMAIFGMGVGFLRNLKKREVNAELFIAMLSVLGMFLYVMLSEANNRQLYNHFYWMFMLAGYGFLQLKAIARKGCFLWRGYLPGKERKA